MASVLNSQRLARKLEKLERESRRLDNDNVVVGYAASYALYVHENPKAAHGAAYNRKHGNPGERLRGPRQQYKFLEQPARQHQREIARIIREGASRGIGLVKAMLIAGLFLQRKSQEIVPVDTGNLKGSAFTERDTAFRGIGSI